MGKKGKEGRRASRKERKAADKERRDEELRLAAERAKKRRILLWGIPALTLVVVLVSWLVLDDTRLVGVSVLVGGLLFLMVALSGLGSSVPARDRLRSGAIDFGSKK